MLWRSMLSFIEKSLPLLGMLMTVILLSFNMILSKLAMSKGTSFYILSVYSHAAASVILVPCGFLFHRSRLPPITFSVLCRVCLLAVFGCIGDIACNAGIKKSSATLGSEILNLVPGFTYLLAIIFRMEGFNARRVSDIAKSLGTVALITGASIVTLYRGPALLSEGFRADSFTVLLSSQHDWILGGILLSTASLAVASWNVFQASILKICPSEMIVVGLYCVFVTLQSTIVALVAERDMDAWKLQAEMGLVAVLFAGFINITFRLYVITWCILKAGPLFVSLFNPLAIVVSAILGFIFFHEALYLGSVVGTIVLVIGFYAVIWGKGEDYHRNKQRMVASIEESASYDAPLMQQNTEEV